MYASPETADILYITDQQLDPRSVDEQVGLDAAVGAIQSDIETITTILPGSTADTLLVGSDIEPERSLELLDVLAGLDSAVGVVVFVGGRDAAFTEAVLEIGSFELVDATVAETSPAVLEQRLDSARSASGDAEPSVAREGPSQERTHNHPLEAERELIEQVLETSPVGIIAIDPCLTITRANRRAADILGIPDREIEGRRYGTDKIGLYGTDGEKLDENTDPVRTVLEDGERITDRKLVVEQSPGDRRTIAVDGAPLIDDGEIQRAILTVEDVTVSVERERRLTEQRDELAKLDQLNRIIRGVDEALLGATNREEIATAVCEQLVASNRYRFAVALKPLGDGEYEPDSWAGPAERFLEATYPTTDRTPANCPGLRAVTTGDPQRIQNLATPADFAPAPWHDAALAAGVQSMIAVPVTYEGQNYGIISVYAPVADTVTERELDVLGELGETVGYAIAAIERREREQILTSLYETTQNLLAADTEREITETVVAVASEVLDAPGVGICLFDDEENTLEFVSATDELIEYYGGVTAFGPGEENSATWQAYATGEQQFFQDIRRSDHVVNPETAARSTLLVPLGEHGVFVVASSDTDVFSEKRRQLIGLLAATTEAALDRVAGRADLRRRDRKLAEQNQQIEQLESLLSMLHGIDQLLGSANTRAEVETGVCKQLQKGGYAFAWIGRHRPAKRRVEPTAWASNEDGYLDAVSLDSAAVEPTVQAATTGSPVLITDVTDHLRETEWARQAADRDIQSVFAVPLVHGETNYGVLGVYATMPGAFDERTRSVLTRIAETTAYAINTIETSQGVLAEQLTELELSIADPGTFLNAVARRAGQPVTYRKITPQPDGRSRVLFSLSSVSVDDILRLEAEFISVESLSAVERGGEYLFRATLSSQTVAATLLDCGGIPSEVVATVEETTAVVRLAGEIDVRLFLDRVIEQFPGTELVSRQSVERSRLADGALFAAIDEELTERQRETLMTAYESGFFESPRDTTGEQLAELLDLSQPTMTHHLREAQRRLFATLFEDEP
ncbi:GAF domain-containing protein [Halobacteriaceae archaeon SHR40]|uniref:GAF domain-containing protein n=1 Tax=Halovenus amylolytica TaxID=2500550 RepID=UPI000FE3234D